MISKEKMSSSVTTRLRASRKDRDSFDAAHHPVLARDNDDDNEGCGYGGSGSGAGGAEEEEQLMEAEVLSNADSEEKTGDDGGDADTPDDDEDEEEEEEEIAPGMVRLVPSLFPGRTPTIYFDYPKDLQLTRETQSLVQPLKSRKLLFKCHWERNCVKNGNKHTHSFTH